jgi:hypothetical protein
LLPLVIWQGSACMVAAFSHLPFQNNNAQKYSWFCIGIAGLQIATLLVAFPLGIQLAAGPFMNWFTYISSFGLLAICYWLSLMRRDNLLFYK